MDENQTPESSEYRPEDAVPPAFRTVCYVLGAILGLGASPAFLAADLPVLAGISGALSGAFNALAFGYNPTRKA